MGPPWRCWEKRGLGACAGSTQHLRRGLEGTCCSQISIHGDVPTNLDKALAIPLGFAIPSFGLEGESETPRGSFQAQAPHNPVRCVLL